MTSGQGVAILVGSYTASMGGRASGIGVLGLDDAGRLRFGGTLAVASSPSFLSVTPSMVYAVDEANGRVESFRRLRGGRLAHAGGLASSGSGPCHISCSPQWLYVSNYATGEIDVFSLGVDGLGALRQSLPGSGSGPHPAQDGPHAHSSLVVGDRVITADLGADRVLVHRWTDGSLVASGAIDVPPGTGPRDLLRDGADRILMLGELDGSLSEIDIDDGRVAWRMPVVEEPVDGDHGAAMAIGGDGRFLYTALRGSDRIAVIDLPRRSIVAHVPAGGRWPRHLMVHGGLLYAACERSDSVTVFRLDESSGIPVQEATVDVPTPTHLIAIDED